MAGEKRRDGHGEERDAVMAGGKRRDGHGDTARTATGINTTRSAAGGAEQLRERAGIGEEQPSRRSFSRVPPAAQEQRENGRQTREQMAGGRNSVKETRCDTCHNPLDECTCQNKDEGTGEGQRESIMIEDMSEFRPGEEPDLEIGGGAVSDFEEGEEVVMETQNSELLAPEKKKRNSLNEIGSSFDSAIADWSGEVPGRPDGGGLGPPQAPPPRRPSHVEESLTTRYITPDAAPEAPQAEVEESDMEMDVLQPIFGNPCLRGRVGVLRCGVCWRKRFTRLKMC
ncbi:hypothetical protein Q5P01_000659 [Channa striata]|uniref:Uncharacterized protein n=1 Tax=Channa striata TaxID=64152 RepID=A0AA88LFQ9_CHASR|nr:hypothetical protein Q5P01_000659 [Channa striata]